ncbi:putative holin-like toxin [Paenibacillus guangzhouensis]|nr:putative holin-like toxin [Paenibacillus guangzhouensis]
MLSFGLFLITLLSYMKKK